MVLVPPHRLSLISRLISQYLECSLSLSVCLALKSREPVSAAVSDKYNMHTVKIL